MGTTTIPLVIISEYESLGEVSRCILIVTKHEAKEKMHIFERMLRTIYRQDKYHSRVNELVKCGSIFFNDWVFKVTLYWQCFPKVLRHGMTPRAVAGKVNVVRRTLQSNFPSNLNPINMAVPQRTLTWLYSVLSKVCYFGATSLAHSNPTAGPLRPQTDLPRSEPDLPRCCQCARPIPLALAANRCLQYAVPLNAHLYISTNRSYPAAYENGFSALLLHLVGTLPVTFRGTTYRFPIALWIPNTYPREPPIIYVTPTQDMAVRVGQHVTLEGRIYHHYLAHWAEAWDVSSIAPGGWESISIQTDRFPYLS